MKSAKNIALAVLSLVCALPAFGANLPANNCEIYIKKIGDVPSSHGSASVPAVVKVGWIGNGETIELVGFWGHTAQTSYNNDPSCPDYAHYEDPTWRVIGPSAFSTYDANEFGEYEFSFPILSGSVLSSCPGYTYSTIGSFFVQTNKNTYWLNPDLDGSKNYDFDVNGYRMLGQQVGYANIGLTPGRSDLRYFNPRSCSN